MIKKYDCSKTLDFTHERNRMCNTIRDCDKCPLNIYSSCTTDRLVDNTQNLIDEVQKWSDNNPEKTRPELSENDIIVLKALKIMGYRWITKDDLSSFAFAYKGKPERCDEVGTWVSSDSFSNSSCRIDYDFSFDARIDKEPTNIDLLLGAYSLCN